MAKKYRKPHRFKKRKPIYKNRFFWLSVLVLVFIFSLFYFLFLAEFFWVKNINLEGQKEIPEEELMLLTGKKLENKILFFPSRSIFLVNLNEVKKDILKSFPEIAEVQISRHFPNELNLLILKREIVATFCLFAQEQTDEEEKCFALDKEGIIFQEKFADDNSLPIINTFSFEEQTSLGKKIIKKEEVISILEINSELKEILGVPIKEFRIDSPDKLIVFTKENWHLYFNPQENIKWQLTKLRALLEEKIPEENRKNLEYIELRFGNFANPKYSQ